MVLAPFSSRLVWRVVATGLLLAAAVATLVAPAPAARAQIGVRDYPIPGGWFFSQESRLVKDAPPFRGYTVEDDAEASFWTEFQRLGGVRVLGYPVTQRYRYPQPNGFLHQAFQRGVLQWRPELGRAELANILEQFTETGRDEELETLGVPRPLPASDLPFAQDAARRMNWITEPRFLARFLFDPVMELPFETQEAAWNLLGLPQGYPERPVYLRERANGKYGHPLYLPYVVQRFQKGALQMFLDDVPNDPTVVPGDGRKGCVTLTAVGRLARRYGADRIIPTEATLPLPHEIPPRVHFMAFVPKLLTNQRTVQFEVIGTGYQPGEPVTIRLKPSEEGLPVVVTHVDATAPDGSYDQVITARVDVYEVSAVGARSGRNIEIPDETILDLTVPTEQEFTSQQPCF